MERRRSGWRERRRYQQLTFRRPPYQEGLSAALTAGGTKPLTNRGVPDVAGDADENTGYDVRVDGSDTVIGGTSAVAPLWAGLIARINSANGKPVGYVNPTLYQNQPAFNDITQGNNGDFAAAQRLGRLHRTGESKRDQGQSSPYCKSRSEAQLKAGRLSALALQRAAVTKPKTGEARRSDFLPLHYISHVAFASFDTEL